MAKYLVETYYTCTFKVNHYLDEINETELLCKKKPQLSKVIFFKFFTSVCKKVSSSF